MLILRENTVSKTQLNNKIQNKVLEKLGIKHDNFFSETDLVNNKLVDKAINKLKKNMENELPVDGTA